MKRVITVLFIFIFFFSLCIKVDAKTLKDLKNELASLEAKKAANDSAKKKTQSEINSANNRISNITGLISSSEQKIITLTGEIATLESKIKRTLFSFFVYSLHSESLFSL